MKVEKIAQTPPPPPPAEYRVTLTEAEAQDVVAFIAMRHHCSKHASACTLMSELQTKLPAFDLAGNKNYEMEVKP